MRSVDVMCRSRFAAAAWWCTLVAAMMPCAAAFGFTVDLAKAKVHCAKRGFESCRAGTAELEKHLALVAPGRTGDGEAVFVVGTPPPGVAAAGRFESHARATGGKVYFWGDDRTTGSRGTQYAVYEFLDKTLGVKWVFPGDDGIVAPPRATLELADGAEWSYTPPFDLVSIRPGSTNAYEKFVKSAPGIPEDMIPTVAEVGARCDANVEWCYRMRVASANRFKYGHAFCDWQDRFFKDHPKWFGLDPAYGRKEDGFRGLPDFRKDRAKLCLSNPEVMDAVVADWKENKGARQYFNICPNDGTPGFCHCEACCRLDARREGEAFLDHLTDRYLWFWNGICDKAMKIRPDVRCVAYIYSYYRHPPRRERVLHPDNMVFGIVPRLIDDYMSMYREWRAVGMKHFFIRPNFMCYSSVFPRGIEMWLYRNFKDSLEYGMIGVDYDGSPRPITDFEYYVITSLASRPGRQFDEIASEFYSQYGAAAGVARAYFEGIRERAEKSMAELRRAVESSDRHILDDSLLSKYACFGATAAGLEGDRAVLAKGEGLELGPADRKRFDKLVMRADHAILAMKLVEALKGGDDAALLAAGDKLLAYRRANRYALGNEGLSWFSNRNCEKPAWNRYFSLVEKRK